MKTTATTAMRRVEESKLSIPYQNTISKKLEAVYAGRPAARVRQALEFIKDAEAKLNIDHDEQYIRARANKADILEEFPLNDQAYAEQLGTALNQIWKSCRDYTDTIGTLSDAIADNARQEGESTEHLILRQFTKGGFLPADDIRVLEEQLSESEKNEYQSLSEDEKLPFLADHISKDIFSSCDYAPSALILDMNSWLAENGLIPVRPSGQQLREISQVLQENDVSALLLNIPKRRNFDELVAYVQALREESEVRKKHFNEYYDNEVKTLSSVIDKVRKILSTGNTSDIAFTEGNSYESVPEASGSLAVSNSRNSSRKPSDIVQDHYSWLYRNGYIQPDFAEQKQNLAKHFLLNSSLADIFRTMHLPLDLTGFVKYVRLMLKESRKDKADFNCSHEADTREAEQLMRRVWNNFAPRPASAHIQDLSQWLDQYRKALDTVFQEDQSEMESLICSASDSASKVSDSVDVKLPEQIDALIRNWNEDAETGRYRYDSYCSERLDETEELLELMLDNTGILSPSGRIHDIHAWLSRHKKELENLEKQGQNTINGFIRRSDYASAYLGEQRNLSGLFETISQLNQEAEKNPEQFNQTCNMQVMHAENILKNILRLFCKQPVSTRIQEIHTWAAEYSGSLQDLPRKKQAAIYCFLQNVTLPDRLSERIRDQEIMGLIPYIHALKNESEVDKEAFDGNKSHAVNLAEDLLKSRLNLLYTRTNTKKQRAELLPEKSAADNVKKLKVDNDLYKRQKSEWSRKVFSSNTRIRLAIEQQRLSCLKDLQAASVDKDYKGSFLLTRKKAAEENFRTMPVSKKEKPEEIDALEQVIEKDRKKAEKPSSLNSFSDLYPYLYPERLGFDSLQLKVLSSVFGLFPWENEMKQNCLGFLEGLLQDYPYTFTYFLLRFSEESFFPADSCFSDSRKPAGYLSSIHLPDCIDFDKLNNLSDVKNAVESTLKKCALQQLTALISAYNACGFLNEIRQKEVCGLYQQLEDFILRWPDAAGSIHLINRYNMFVKQSHRKGNGKGSLVTTAYKLAHYSFMDETELKKAFYVYAFAFHLNYYTEKEKKGLVPNIAYEKNRDIEKTLFGDYINTSLIRKNFHISGSGINFKNYAEAVYVIYLRKMESGQETHLHGKNILADSAYIKEADAIIRSCTDADPSLPEDSGSYTRVYHESFDNDLTFLTSSDSKNIKDWLKQSGYDFRPSAASMSVFGISSGQRTAEKILSHLQKIYHDSIPFPENLSAEERKEWCSGLLFCSRNLNKATAQVMNFDDSGENDNKEINQKIIELYETIHTDIGDNFETALYASYDPELVSLLILFANETEKVFRSCISDEIQPISCTRMHLICAYFLCYLQKKMEKNVSSASASSDAFSIHKLPADYFLKGDGKEKTVDPDCMDFELISSAGLDNLLKSCRYEPFNAKNLFDLYTYVRLLNISANR